jgi:hypothetical protein
MGVVLDESCGREQTPIVLEWERLRWNLGGLTYIRLWNVSIFGRFDFADNTSGMASLLEKPVGENVVISCDVHRLEGESSTRS